MKFSRSKKLHFSFHVRLYYYRWRLFLTLIRQEAGIVPPFLAWRVYPALMQAAWSTNECPAIPSHTTGALATMRTHSTLPRMPFANTGSLLVLLYLRCFYRVWRTFFLSCRGMSVDYNLCAHLYIVPIEINSRVQRRTWEVIEVVFEKV